MIFYFCECQKSCNFEIEGSVQFSWDFSKYESNNSNKLDFGENP